jgi:hypothetical protein
MTKIWCGRDGWGYLFDVIDAYVEPMSFFLLSTKH